MAERAGHPLDEQQATDVCQRIGESDLPPQLVDIPPERLPLGVARRAGRSHRLPPGPQVFPGAGQFVESGACRGQVPNQTIASLEDGLDCFVPAPGFTRCVDAVLHAPVPLDQFLLDRRAEIGQDRRRNHFGGGGKPQGDRTVFLAERVAQVGKAHGRLAIDASRRQGEFRPRAAVHRPAGQHDRLAGLKSAPNLAPGQGEFDFGPGALHHADIARHLQRFLEVLHRNDQSHLLAMVDARRPLPGRFHQRHLRAVFTGDERESGGRGAGRRGLDAAEIDGARSEAGHPRIANQAGFRPVGHVATDAVAPVGSHQTQLARAGQRHVDLPGRIAVGHRPGLENGLTVDVGAKDHTAALAALPLDAHAREETAVLAPQIDDDLAVGMVAQAFVECFVADLQSRPGAAGASGRGIETEIAPLLRVPQSEAAAGIAQELGLVCRGACRGRQRDRQCSERGASKTLVPPSASQPEHHHRSSCLLHGRILLGAEG